MWMILALVIGYGLSTLLSRALEPRHLERTPQPQFRSTRTQGLTLVPLEGRRAPAIFDDERKLVRQEERFALKISELQRLFEAAWGAGKPGYGWVLEDSFAWVTYRCDHELTGFANIAWDGGAHFFLLDVTVHPDWRGRGIARQMVRDAIELCRGKGDWIHVDAESQELMDRVYVPCGFRPTAAGVIDLRETPAA